MADEGLHEIQLNGKQLVFLFMASTVVAVVIFLCGVMVGRGVRAQRPAEAIEASADAAADPTAAAKATSTPAPAPSTVTTPGNAPVAANETLTYPSRLEGQEPADETLKPARSEPAAAPLKAAPKPELAVAPKRELAAAPKREPAVAQKPEPAVAAKPEPAVAQAAPSKAGVGFVVQVAAVNDRREADAIAKRLAGKGYPTFVTTPRGGAPNMFRVRIGTYQTRREAETVAARLEKEDQFKPWITR